MVQIFSFDQINLCYTFKRLSFLFFILFFFLQMGWTQEPPCITPVCGNMYVEIVREYANVTTDCPSTKADCGDRFHQMFYKVYLKYKDPMPPSPAVPFNLDYQFLNIKVDLVKFFAGQHSHIDIAATNSCFEQSTNGSLWSDFSTNNGDKVLFNPDLESVLISFQNLNSGDYCGGTSGSGTGSTQIPFEYTTPSLASCGGSSGGTMCAYVELFTIVVNAWPGEYIQFSFDSDKISYIQSDDTACDPLNVENSGTNNGLSSTLVDQPTSFTSTENDFIQLQLSGPTTGTNEHYFTLALENTATHNFTMNLVEFYVKVSVANYDETLTYDGYEPVEILPIGADPINSGYDAFLLHYIIDGTPWTLSSSSTTTIGEIHFHDPTLISKNYRVLLSVEGGRLETEYSTVPGNISVCTSLDAVGSTGYSVSNQFDPCSTSTILFNIEKVAGNSCSDPYQYKVGFLNTSTTVTRPIKRVEFDLEFEMDSGVSISSTVDYTNWGNPSELYGLFGSPVSVQQISGNVFRYVFSTTDANALSFVLDAFTNYMVISFTHSGGGCVKSIKITNLVLIYAYNTGCIPPINNFIDPGTHKINLSICGPKLYGLIKTEINETIDEVEVSAGPPTSPVSPCLACNPDCDPAFSTVLTKSDGKYGFCDLCSTCTHFIVTPTKIDNPLNGVTTYDLVLISKHIIGIEPLDSPYKIFAADANNDMGVTISDIVELRKLILGIYSELPNSDSWRFIDAAFTFTNSDDPWDPSSPPASINCVDPTANNSIDFTAIKVGDVNNTAVGSRPADRPVTTLSFGAENNKSKGIITIPVVYTGVMPLEAIQLGIRFDPGSLALIGPSIGDIPGFGGESFGLTHVNKGEIRALWLPMSDDLEKIMPGQILFYLSFQVLGKEHAAKTGLYFDDNILDNAAWTPDGAEYSILASAATQSRQENSSNDVKSFSASILPNPVSEFARLTVATPQFMKGRVSLYGAFGNNILLRDIDFVPGKQVIEIPETAKLPAGVYFWKVSCQGVQVQGHLIKQ